ncbi:MAG TPA: GNAT family N-acetyltransferase [Devosiaceae bacterium]|nr:GNAT family N-acetyltransferase [Devosiaceae bacterium]
MNGAARSISGSGAGVAVRPGARAPASDEVTKVAAEVLDESGLRALDGAEWDALAASALEDNPFYARQHVLAGLDTIDREAGLRALALRSGGDGQLRGLFLFQTRKFPGPGATAAGNLYQVAGTPLVQRDHAEPVIGAWLDALATGIVPRHWSLPHLHLGGAFMRIGDRLAAERGFAMLPVCGYRRARLRRLPGGFEEHLGTAMSKRRVKDIQRTLRRLEECGDLQFERTRDPALVARRVHDFLRLEHAGWKGAAGTSLLADPVHAEFARRAYGGQGAAKGLASVDSLLLDGQPIAISINIQAGSTAFTPKCAFDETYRKYSPGLVLEYLVIEAFYADDSCAEMDAATTVEGHVVQGLWNDEKPMATVIVGPRGWRTAALATLEVQREALKKRAKAALAARPLAPVTALLQASRRRLQSLHGDVMITLICATHVVEGLVKVGL